MFILQAKMASNLRRWDVRLANLGLSSVRAAKRALGWSGDRMERGTDGASPSRWSVRKALELIDGIEANLRSLSSQPAEGTGLLVAEIQTALNDIRADLLSVREADSS
jgi:hypothetical protein